MLIKPIDLLRTDYTEHAIILALRDGSEIVMHAEGDSCSISYIEDCDMIEALQDTKLNKIECVSNYRPIKEFDWGSVHKWIMYKFYTDKGIATFSLRNESNGYYTGFIFVEDDETSEQYFDLDQWGYR